MTTNTTTTARAAPTATFLLALFAETPLHPGTGQSTGVVDLPVQRERHTQFPIIPSTSLKGCLRELAERRWGRESREVHEVFGPPAGDGANLHAGAVALTDARLLSFPVRSLSHVFVWVTCPLVLGRLARDLGLAGGVAAGLAVTQPVEGSLISASADLTGTVVLEDLTFEAMPNPEWQAMTERLARFLPDDATHAVYRQKFRQHLVLIGDNDFSYLVQHATQVTARIKLVDQLKTSENLWYEETLPADTLMYTLVRPEQPRRQDPALGDAAEVRARVTGLLGGEGSFIQVGGNETVGQGWCSVRVVDDARGDGND